MVLLAPTCTGSRQLLTGLIGPGCTREKGIGILKLFGGCMGFRSIKKLKNEINSQYVGNFGC
jgi:hypothetical protein